MTGTVRPSVTLAYTFVMAVVVVVLIMLKAIQLAYVRTAVQGYNCLKPVKTILAKTNLIVS